MPSVPGKGGINAVRHVAPSPMQPDSSPEEAQPCYCVVEDVHGRPASRPLSLSFTPERAPIPVFRAPQAVPSSFVSPVFDNEMRLSGDAFPSPDQIGFSPHGFAPAAVGGAGVGMSGAVVQQQRSGTASHSRNGFTTLASSVSGLHVTQSGVVIPPIQGIPQPNGLPAPTPVQYAKVKQRGKGGQKRSRLAVKGAFSNMTSVAVLQQVQPFQKKTRQVEAAGWSRLDYTDAPLDNDEAPAAEEGVGAAAVRASAGDQRSAATSAALDQSAPLPSSPAGMQSAAPPPPCNARPSASHHSRSSSVASLTPSEAAMVAAAWEEDVAAAAAASAAASGHLMPCVGSGTTDEQDEWDRAEEEAMRIQAMMLQQQSMQQQQRHQPPQHPQQQLQQSPLAPTALHCGRATPRCHSPVIVLHSDPTEEVAPYAIRTAASANRSPTLTKATPSRVPSPANDIYSPHRCESPAEGLRSRSEGKTTTTGATAVSAAAPSTVPAAPPTPPVKVVATPPAHTASHTASPAHPVGFAACAEKGQQRRAEAERAQMARAAEAAGQPLAAFAQGAAVDDATRRPRKLSVLPAPRGFEAFADRGHARRSEVEREAAARQQAETANCTHVPRINRRSSVTSTAVGGASRKVSTASTGVGVDGASTAGDAVASSEDGAPRVSVFDRLSHEAEVREERQRQRQDKFTPSFVPHRVTAGDGTTTPAVAEPQPIARANRQGRKVFEGLYALAKKPSTSPPPPPSQAAATNGRNTRLRTAPTDVSGEAEESGAAAAGDAAGTATTAKKPWEAVTEHLRSMQTRDEERRIKWAQRLSEQAAAEKDAAHHPTLNPTTTALADRARARYRVKEEQKRQQEAVDAATGTAAQRGEGRPQQRAAAAQSSALVSAAAEGKTPGYAPTSAAAAAHTLARRSLAAEFLAHQQKTEERRTRNLEQLRLQRADAELRECTFRPQLNSASARMAQRILVESYHTQSEEAALPVVMVGAESYRTTSVADGEGSRQPSQSPTASAQSRELMQELRSASPLDMPPSHQHQHHQQQRHHRVLPVTSTDYEEEDDEESFTQQMPPLHVSDGVAEDPRSPEPLSAQLRNLEEMLREWKELERECSPMLRQRQQEGLVE